MTSNKPVYLSLCISVCSLLAYGSAAIHFCMITVGILTEPLYLLNTSGGVYENLHIIWRSRIVRRIVSVLVRSPLRSSTLRLVNFTMPLPANSGCIIVCCHTPWKRLLVQWCLENDFALIISGGRCTHHMKERKILRKGKGFNELRDIVNYLQQNGRIIITADVFNDLNNCPVKFLGSYHNASLLPARLARIAHVPLIVTIPILTNGTINFNHGSQFDFKALKLDPCSVIQSILSSLEDEINKKPSIWPSYVR